MITLREARFPEDVEAIARIDTSFATDTIFSVSRDNDQMSLRLKGLDRPLTKQLPITDLDDPNRPWEFAAVAVAEGMICGFIAAGYEAWNRRMTIYHLYVNAPNRNTGIGRELVDHAERHGAARGAISLWLEASNVNVPAIRAYRRMRFEWCGLDTSLYRGTSAAEETALFFERSIVGR